MPKKLFARHNRSALHQDVYSILKEAILRGQLQPGSRLCELDIATQMGVSRAPIREAFRQLEHEGLAVNSPYKGTFVATFAPDDIHELCAVRSLLEGYAVAEAVQRITPDDMERLTTIIDEMLDVARQDVDLAVFIEKDLAFHEEVCRLSGNRRLFAVWSTLASQTRLYFMMVNQAYLDREAVASLHIPALEAIRARDVEGAKRALQDAIESAGKETARRLEEES